ncbi:MAG: hypothetical protein Kow00103_11850 [Candidatus Caldatribacteriota bacterium]
MFRDKKGNKIKIYFFSFILILWLINLSGSKVVAEEIYPSQKINLATKNIIILDDLTLQEMIYVSPDQSILIFRNRTPQLEQLKIGDVLWFYAELKKDFGFLRQIANIQRNETMGKGVIIYTIPWQENNPPVITSLMAQPSTLVVGEQADLICYAADEDQDELYYNWYTSEGTVTGTGAYVQWVAPYQSGSYLIICEVNDARGGKDTKFIQIVVLEKPPMLSEKEKLLIRKFGWRDGHRAIRWPEGRVAVYDGTNFSKMQEVLSEWNKVVGDRVIFYLSSDPLSPVKITYNYELGQRNLCTHIDTHWRNYQLYAAEIQINPDSQLCGFPQNLFAAYLHCFAGVVGFNIWQGITIELEDWQDFTQISEIVQQMIKALYRIPPGYDLN